MWTLSQGECSTNDFQHVLEVLSAVQSQEANNIALERAHRELLPVYAGGAICCPASKKCRTSLQRRRNKHSFQYVLEVIPGLTLEEVDNIATERATRTVSGMPYQRCYLMACSKEVNDSAAESEQ